MSASHAHGIPSTDNERALRIALALTGSFLIAEVIGGDPHCPAPGRSPANLWLPPL